MNPKSATLTKDEWLTPPEIIKSLGIFDLDPCSPINRPWDTALNHFTMLDDGLLREWFGRVWLNPPYGKALAAWMNRMALHGNGIALTFARTDTNVFHDNVFSIADSIFFIRQRLTFLNVDGSPGHFNGGAPSVLIAYGEQNSEAIGGIDLKGHHVPLNQPAHVLILWDRPWRQVVKSALIKLNGKADLNQIYAMVDEMFPHKGSKNSHKKEKIRQILQKHFVRVKQGTYRVPHETICSTI
jgi:hypothetical protein